MFRFDNELHGICFLGHNELSIENNVSNFE